MRIDTVHGRHYVTNDDADYYKRVAEWERDAAWGGESDDDIAVQTLRELEPVKPSLTMRDYKRITEDEYRGMELTGIMAVFLVGLVIGLIVGALIWA